MEDNAKYGIIGMIALLAGVGGYMILTPGELDNSYYCPSSGEFGVFYGGISSTGLTAYPYKENKTDYSRCTNSKWILLKDYSAEIGITPEELMGEQTFQNQSQNQFNNIWGKQYYCNQLNCVEVNK